ncbi:PTS sugar transporter subunit IIA [Caldimonas brevitalea]|uniref:PTS fructose transporter subunit IIA n=1 Tax=Caldimonas brevitalea TaxID=413882 RepID=A0A0G3BJM8_9BURK|nr:PTS fructose transporter subunit IIA [Caldimonas brevitalea]AKJ27586.1 PTS fructose transporter subunit IIA [Caldimonas brevitalea]
MSGILIIAHAPLASALKACAAHTFPDCAAAVEALDVAPNLPLEDIEAQARVLLARVKNPEALILTDVFGATPCNVAQRLGDGVTVKVVAGVNVPMLWRSLCYQNEPLDTLVARAVAGASQGVMQVTTSKPQNQSQSVGYRPGHDQADHHHQQ